MKTLLFVLLATILTGATVCAADLGGTWAIDGEVHGNTVKFVTTWKHDGPTLSGTAIVQGKNVPVSGSVNENVVTFTLDAETNGTTYHMVFSGTLGDDGSLTGTIAVSGVEGAFTARRQ